MYKLAYAYICICFKTTVLIGSCENATILSFSCYDMSPLYDLLLQHARFLCPPLPLDFAQTHVHWVSDAIQPSHSLLSPSSPAFNLSQHQSFPMSQFFASGGQSIGASASTSVLPMNIQDWLLWPPCSPRDSQESSPTPQFKSTNSSALSFLYGPILTSIHDYWKNNSID